MSVAPLLNTPNATLRSAQTQSANVKATRDAPAQDTGGNVQQGSGSASSSQEIMDNFMTLFVAQLQNQDPTNPMDNNQLTTQLAQINMTAGIEQLNTTVGQVGNLVLGSQQMSTADWVGRSVMIDGDSTVSTATDGNQRFGMALSSPADKVTVTLTDKKSGDAYSAELKDVKAGVHAYTLGDLDNFQPAAPPADTEFTVSYSAVTGSGAAPDIVSLKWAKVDAVSLAGGVAQLQLGVDGTAMLGDVYMVE